MTSQTISSRIPNFTAIPNEFLDAWMSKLTGGEFKVLMCLCRKLYGWHKREDYISANQISEITGLNRATVFPIIKKLISFGLVITKPSKNKNGGFGSNLFSIFIPEVDPPSPQKGLPPPSHKKRLPLVVKSDPQKKQPKSLSKDSDIGKKEIVVLADPKPAFSYKKMDWENIDEKQIEAWQKKFPDIDIKLELDKAKDWLIAKPSRKKKNISKFLASVWFARAQEDAKYRLAQKAQKEATKPKQASGDPIPCERSVLALERKYGPEFVKIGEHGLNIFLNGQNIFLSYGDCMFKECLFNLWRDLEAYVGK